MSNAKSQLLDPIFVKNPTTYRCSLTRFFVLLFKGGISSLACTFFVIVIFLNCSCTLNKTFDLRYNLQIICQLGKGGFRIKKIERGLKKNFYPPILI